ncbi:hypothetical protein HD601_001809 [Jiangella mangrovi]|uniref:Uncharacterized protein n=1 Tax=Jiangella mangrovi TaxID=1524084 RepID=A0A7W9GNP7_9ACTN|nr:hypothetical protein [Jiangella mangrovi]
MGLLDRFRSARTPTSAISAQILGGSDDLEVVGEVSYQDALWRIGPDGVR